MSEWQPIETAPKDGTQVDLWMPDARLPSGYIVKAHRVPAASWSESRWVDWQFDRVDEGEQNPTHWMPLPAPPRTPPERNSQPTPDGVPKPKVERMEGVDRAYKIHWAK